METLQRPPVNVDWSERCGTEQIGERYETSVFCIWQKERERQKQSEGRGVQRSSTWRRNVISVRVFMYLFECVLILDAFANIISNMARNLSRNLLFNDKKDTNKLWPIISHFYVEIVSHIYGDDLHLQNIHWQLFIYDVRTIISKQQFMYYISTFVIEIYHKNYCL